jgi:4-amino-4-deoxychorismate lyase
MSLLLESIKLQGGVYQNLFHHEQRMNRSLRMLCGTEEHLNLEECLNKLERPLNGLYKCRIKYDDVFRDVEFMPYVPKSIQTLKIVEDNNISYEHKFIDRRSIDDLFEQRDGCDDILIIKEEMVTDSSYANIAFKGKTNWYTPWTALLNGTMREYLLERGVILQESISKDDLKSFRKFKLINALIGFDGPELDIDNIVF